MSSGRFGRRRWLVAGVVAGWAVLLVAAGAVSALRDPPTWKDQTTLAEAHRALDAATGELLRAAGPATVPALDGYEAAPCRITPARDGTNLHRTVRLFTPAGTEDDLLNRIVAGLPSGYRAEGPTGPQRSVYADAGTFVALRGGAGDPGELRFRLSTDCRPGTAPALGAAVADTAGREPVLRALDLLGVAATGWHAFVAPCPGGGQARTVLAEAPVAGRPLPEALAGHPGTGVLAEPERYAYRDGDAGVAVRAGQESLVVTATTGCPATQ